MAPVRRGHTPIYGGILTDEPRELSADYWQAPPHNCTPREAVAQIDKFKQNHDAQNDAKQDVTDELQA